MEPNDERRDDVRAAIIEYLSKSEFEYSSDPPERFMDDMVNNYERLSDVSDRAERLSRATAYFRICRLESGSLLERLKGMPDYGIAF